jgi:hypothetical protein
MSSVREGDWDYISKFCSRERFPANGSYEQIELRLSGLVIEQQGKLRVYNRIYGAVFNQYWVDQALAYLRPYAALITAWLASNFEDESQLLRGQALRMLKLGLQIRV